MSQILNMPPLQLGQGQKLPIQSLRKRGPAKEKKRSLAPLLPTSSASPVDRCVPRQSFLVPGFLNL